MRKKLLENVSVMIVCQEMRMGRGKDGGGVTNDHGETWADGCSHYLCAAMGYK